ncbi:hypothetical protein GLP21_19465 [Photobacterium carnosum]|uniref:hypothetical protein n=1 Tax=Photobacterium carnosum TaxID=2023717 RepID=UPI001E371D48|nr:hypothetical protein [Photobacterium carnosum]MCD9516855.1 hypothetical protein [Photobacterium carnosum]MCD9550797.1 hypothetical protein [Photobacterium carnosum]MCF2304690.1 hypothetical protein [Photobacterium carnosum]
MKRLKIGVASLLLLSCGSVNAEMKSKNLEQGWRALVNQSDPFDTSKVEIVQITKGAFTFRCRELNMEAPSYGYESLSFRANLKYIVDGNNPVDKSGGYSTYLGGSDLVTDSRYYHFSLTSADIAAFKKGNSAKVAGKYSKTGWFTKSLNLVGFTKAYSQMCK